MVELCVHCRVFSQGQIYPLFCVVYLGFRVFEFVLVP